MNQVKAETLNWTKKIDKDQAFVERERRNHKQTWKTSTMQDFLLPVWASPDHLTASEEIWQNLQHQLKVEKKEFSELSKSAILILIFQGYFGLQKGKVWFKALGCGEVGPGRSQLIARKSVRQKLPNCTLVLCCPVLVVQHSELFWPQCSVKHFPNYAFTPTYITMLFNALTLDLFLGMDFCST